MEPSEAQEILKKALLLERRGQAFYTKNAKETKSSAIRDFFQVMAQEEDKHVAYLSEAFKEYQQSGKFAADMPGDKPGEFAQKVLSKDICSQITAADYEGAAIAAAIEMEKAAVQLYSSRAKSTEDENEKKLYDWLTHWEREHLRLLAEINNDLMDEIWQEQNFWPT